MHRRHGRRSVWSSDALRRCRHKGAAPKSFPETPVWIGDRLYLSNAFTEAPTGGEEIVSLWHYRQGVAVPVASLGNAAAWELLSSTPFRARWPAGVEPSSDPKSGSATFAWSDLNDDALVQPEEVQIVAGPTGSVTLDGELGLTTSSAVRYTPVGFTAKGAPRYDLAQGKALAEGGRLPVSDGWPQIIAARNGRTVFTSPPAPQPRCYLSGFQDGRPSWTYPEEFMGLHNSHLSMPPRHPGELIGTTRLLGPSFLAPVPANPDLEPIELWAINGNYGNVYLFTTDGLFVATLFKDSRAAIPWPEQEKRGADLGDVSLSEECFLRRFRGRQTGGCIWSPVSRSRRSSRSRASTPSAACPSSESPSPARPRGVAVSQGGATRRCWSTRWCARRRAPT